MFRIILLLFLFMPVIFLMSCGNNETADGAAENIPPAETETEEPYVEPVYPEYKLEYVLDENELAAPVRIKRAGYFRNPVRGKIERIKKRRKRRGILLARFIPRKQIPPPTRTYNYSGR